jgi:hypothetical protein
MLHLDLRPGVGGDELEGERDDGAAEHVVGVQSGLSDLFELALLVPVEFEAPRVTIDQQQLPDADL